MSRPTRLVVLPLAAAVAGIVGGAIAIGLVQLAVGLLAQDGGTWTDFGLLVGGMFLAVAAGVVIWVAALGWASRRLFNAGRRLGPVILAVGAVFVLAFVWGVLIGALEDEADLTRAASNILSAVGALLVLAIPSAAFVLWDRQTISP